MIVKCQYCSHEITKAVELCPMCGGPVPQGAFVTKEKTTIASNRRPIKISIFAAFIAIVALSAIFLRQSPEPAPIIVVEETPTPPQYDPPTYDIYEYSNDTPRQAPYLHITDPGLRQSLELLFGMELHHIGWDTIETIKGLAIHRDGVIFIFESVSTISEMDSIGINILSGTDIRELYQLRYIENLETVAIRTGQITQEVLQGLPKVETLEVASGRTIADLTPFTDLPNLRRLTVTGRNFASLQGISELASLYALNLAGTGITDLSILSHQRHITDLTLIDNRELGSFITLQDMTWLKSLHIERSGDRDLNFISNLTNLEALAIIRTETRTYNYILPLTNLRYLRLFDNRDVPEIPSLAGFTQLEELHLDTGRNTGTVRPTDYLEGLTSVRRMTLHNPDTLDPLRGMQYLEELDISFGWLLTDASPLGYLSSLTRLRIYGSRTFGSEVHGMNAIGRLSGLRQLDMPGNDLYFYWDFLYGLENLEVLNISSNNVIGDFAGIGRLQNLRVLHMSNIRIMSSYRISRDGGMVGISFVGTAYVNDFADALANLTNLEVLSIESNNVSNIDFVTGMNRLRVLHAEDNFIADVSPLAELSSLEFVNLRRNAVANWGVLDKMINTTILGR